MSSASTTSKRSDDTTRAAKVAAILGAAFALVALRFFGVRAAFSVLLGAGVAVANLLALRGIIRALLRAPEGDGGSDGESKDHRGEGKRGGAAWGVFAVLKLVVLFGGIWILLTSGIVDPMPLVVGYGVLPLGIALSSLWSGMRPRA
jgi:hypothetical protein